MSHFSFGSDFVTDAMILRVFNIYPFCYWQLVYIYSQILMCQQTRRSAVATAVWVSLSQIQRELKKGATLTMAITLSIVDNFLNSFTVAKSTKFLTKSTLCYLLTLSKEYLTFVQAYYIFLYVTMLVKPSMRCCHVRHRISFHPTYGHQQPWPKSSRLHGVGHNGTACLPEHSDQCWHIEGMLTCSITVRFLTGHYRHCNWPVEKVSPGMCPCKWWTSWTPFVNKLMQAICISSCVFGSSSFCLSDFYWVDAWWSIVLSCSLQSIELIKDSE